MRSQALTLFPHGCVLLALLAIFSSAVWGLGYFGQPHILARFMSVKDVKMFPRATWIAMIWVVISLGAAVLIGLLAIPMFEGLDKSESEKVFIFMIGRLFNPWLGGVLLAAIYSRRTSWQSALCGMDSGTIVMLAWYFLGLSAHMYEILPGFAANALTIAAMNRFFPQKDAHVLSLFDRGEAELRASRR